MPLGFLPISGVLFFLFLNKSVFVLLRKEKKVVDILKNAAVGTEVV